MSEAEFLKCVGQTNTLLVQGMGILLLSFLFLPAFLGAGQVR